MVGKEVKQVLLDELVDLLVEEKNLERREVKKLIKFGESEGHLNASQVLGTGLITLRAAKSLYQIVSEYAFPVSALETRTLPSDYSLKPEDTYYNHEYSRRWVPLGGVREIPLEEGVYLLRTQFSERLGIPENKIDEVVEKCDIKIGAKKYGPPLFVNKEVAARVKQYLKPKKKKKTKKKVVKNSHPKKGTELQEPRQLEKVEQQKPNPPTLRDSDHSENRNRTYVNPWDKRRGYSLSTEDLGNRLRSSSAGYRVTVKSKTKAAWIPPRES